ncbi:UNVERIFIED_CONTAM: Ethylene-responsive transcription factor WRI1 [Sesamum calycinum]|uniref:Ethylene-responsive transcription factor WRI1 n=1 Tax=Sesamum calycinum TaxID=2727403 RepID=A0AAW2MMM4_9LAMI
MEQILKEEKLNMAMRMVKSEENLGRREARCVKRRRREVVADILNCNGEQKEADGTSAATTVKRSSRFRGVSKHRWTGRYEAHLWDKLLECHSEEKRETRYLTLHSIFSSVLSWAYDDEEAAARAYDLAALKYWGTSTFTNFPISDYEAEIEIMQAVTKEEYLASLRRKSSGFSRGVSKYRGVARHHHNGRWEARIGRVFGNKYLYLGTYSTQEEAARAYDIAAIEYRGINAITNFDLSTYIRWLKPGANISVPAQESKPAFSSPFLTGEETLSTSLKRKAFSAEDLQETFELVEKNSNVSEEETDGENNRNLIQVGSEDEYGGLFCDGSEDIPFAVSSSGHSIELQEHHHFDYNPDTVGSNTIGMATIY